jgi:hypothetical protein
VGEAVAATSITVDDVPAGGALFASSTNPSSPVSRPTPASKRTATGLAKSNREEAASGFSGGFSHGPCPFVGQPKLPRMITG